MHSGGRSMEHAEIERNAATWHVLSEPVLIESTAHPRNHHASCFDIFPLGLFLCAVYSRKVTYFMEERQNRRLSHTQAQVFLFFLFFSSVITTLEM
jgi:hypothetical protein